MKVEIWSDYVCPFCYIGRRRLEKALEQFPHRERVTIEYKSYELAPDAIIDPNIKYYESIAIKFGITVEEAKLNTKRITKQAKEEGLLFNFDKMKPTNTIDAHRLTKYAIKQGKGQEMTEYLLQSYFTDGCDLSDQDTLITLASHIGLDKAEVKKLLESKKYSSIVRDDEEEADSIGVKTVPFFVFNEQHAVAGLQRTEMFAAILDQLWETEGKYRQDNKSDTKIETTYCSGEGCSIADD